MIGKTNIKVKPNKKINYVEYIESTGTQYIDTGYLNNSTYSRIELDFTPLQESATSVYFGAKTDDSSTALSLWLFYSSSKYALVAASSSEANQMQIAMTPGTDYVLDASISNGKNITCKLNGVETSLTTSVGTLCTTKNIFLFANNNNGSVSNKAKMRVRSAKFYDANNVLVRDFKPCKDEAGVYCLYDKVEKKYYYNKGTGNFIGEPTPVEYLESTGTQYIDTGVVPTNKTKWVLDYQFLADTNANGAETAQNGCGYWSNSERFVIGYGGGQLNVAIGVNGASTVNGDTARHTFILDVPNKKGYIDDNVISCNYSSFAGKESVCIFNRKENSNTSKYIHRGRLYGSKIYENGVLIRDFRPVLDANNVACLRDEITKTYLYNAGTGSFIGGASI